MKIKKQTNKPDQLSHEEIWDKYNKMIKGIAHKLHKEYDKPYDELLSEGWFGVFTKLTKWDPKRSSLCTYVHHCANFKMLDYCIKPLKEIPMDVYNPNEEKYAFIQKETKPDGLNWFQNFLNEINEETHSLIKIFFEAPKELYGVIKPNQPKTSQKKLRNYMIDVLDWKNADILKAFKEIKHCL